MKFNRACGGGYAPPHCLEEGPGYVAAKGPTAAHGQVGAIGGSVSGAVLDNYALNWITLPTAGGPFRAQLRNTSTGGRLMASLACDTGTGLVVQSFSAVAEAGQAASVKFFDPSGCQGAVAVITNVAQTEENPSASAGRSYTLSILPPPAPTTTKLRVRRTVDEILVKGRLLPPHPGKRMKVSLFERHGAKWRKVDGEQPRLTGKRFRAEFDRPDGRRCMVEARFPGDDDHLPSKRSRTSPC